jgi:predicted unusual protein kinase regulating ubiquinone biosynthesis (AarF/ABC1/UbiB family)
VELQRLNRTNQPTTAERPTPPQAAPGAGTVAVRRGDHVQQLVRRLGDDQMIKALHDATEGQKGTDETTVFQVLSQLRTPADAGRLDAAYRKAHGKGVEDLLKSEMSGSQLRRALDLFQKQAIDWTASSGLAYHVEGAEGALDAMGTSIKQHPVAAAAIVGVGVVASMRSPSLMAAVGLAGLGWQAGRLVNHEVHALQEHDPEKRAKRQISAGDAAAQVLMSLPGTRSNVKLLKGAFGAAKGAESAGGAIRAFVNHESTWGKVTNFRRPYSPDVGGKIDAGPSTGDPLKDAQNYWKAVQKSKDPNAMMARQLVESYQKLTPEARLQTVQGALKEMTPAMRTRVLKAVETMAQNKQSPLGQLLKDASFWTAKPETQMQKLAVVLAKGGEEDITSLVVAMGTGHIKIGQVLADSPVVPEQFGTALRKLQKDLPAMPAADIDAMLQKAGMADRYKVGKLLGVASVGQVHLATDTKTGQTVVLKFLKPNVNAKEINAEFRVMDAYLKPYFKSVHPEQARFLKDQLAGFRDGIIDEIDFAKEGANIRKFGQIYPNQAKFEGIELIEVAKNKQVLVMKPAVGVDFKDLQTLPRQQQVTATQDYAHSMFQQIFGEKHYFHADPHPGNVKFNPQTGKVVFMDMGATATISATEQRQLYELTFHLMSQDAKGLASFYLDNAERVSSKLPKEELVKAFTADIQRFFDRPGYSPNYMIESAKEINELAQKHGIWPKSANIWLTKTMFTMANVWNRSITTEDTLFRIGGPYMLKGLVQAFKADPKAFAGTIANIARTVGSNPVTVAKSALEVATINPGVVSQVPQGFWTALRGITAAGSVTGQIAAGHAATTAH